MSCVFPGCKNEIGKGCRIHCAEHAAEAKRDKRAFQAKKDVLSSKPGVIDSAGRFGFRDTANVVGGRSKHRRQYAERLMYEARMRGEW